MEPIRYKPAEILSTFDEEGPKTKASVSTGTISETVKKVAGAVVNFGKKSWSEFAQKQMNGTEYVLLDEYFEVRGMSGSKKVSYKDVKEMSLNREDRVTLLYEGGALTIKPLAHLVSGTLKVPVGWVRNGVDVPYALLIDELAARCGVEVELP